MMYSLEKLAEVNDMVSGYVCHQEKPTLDSINRVNEHFGFSLPQGLIDFAMLSAKFGSFFASLGEDYYNHYHIIRVNRIFRRLRRRAHGDKWRAAKPKPYIVINHGHDRCCDCIDTSDWNEAIQEYRIVFWYPGAKEVEYRYDSFLHYINHHVMAHANYHLNNINSSGNIRTPSREVAERLKRVLEL
ncbi:SMI1/KNR4 family protein [Hahella sp. NBU794]|uniref:SMI1/KNR4 family protein n=2 Tax=unclassified Hahella TaxID=2624107 RepID=UPI003D702065|nr:SMI1/KNR4 family protein [Hahella sp. HN01]